MYRYSLFLYCTLKNGLQQFFSGAVATLGVIRLAGNDQ